MELTYTQDNIAWTEKDGYRRATVDVQDGETAWNPASTKPERSLIGPLRVTYTQHPDGGTDCAVDTLSKEPVDMTALIGRMEDALAEAREALDEFRRAQDPETADVGNEDHIMTATAGLDQFEGAITDLVP